MKVEPKGLFSNKLMVKNIDNLVNFYTRNFGLEILENKKNGHVRLGFDDSQSISLELIPVNGDYSEDEGIFNGSRDEVYWKIGFALSDVVRGVKVLRNKNIKCSDPKQFKQVGYMSHLNDSHGFSLELLQNVFESNFEQSVAVTGYPLEQPIRVGQLSLRINKLEENLEFYQNTLGMKLLAIEEIEEFGFTLYFLAFTDDVPPSDDIKSPSIREWLYQRPYTTLELQHCYQRTINDFSDVGNNNKSLQAFAGYSMKIGNDFDKIVLNLHRKNAKVVVTDGRIEMRDPNNIPIELFK